MRETPQKLKILFPRINLIVLYLGLVNETITKLLYAHLSIENRDTRKSKNALDMGTIRLSMKTEKLLAPICYHCSNI
jgi:hypothetical protein